MQLIDASIIQSIRKLRVHPTKEDDINVALGVPATKYNRLNHPTKAFSSVIRHTQNKNIEFSIIQLYNLFTAYLQNITTEMFEAKPMFIVGKAVYNKDGEEREHLSMSFADIIKLQTIDNIHEQIVKRVFRSIEELRSTTKLLDKILKDTKVSIPTDMKENALMYLEMRHLFIHNHGKVDAKYATAYGKKFSKHLAVGDDLPTKYETFSNALTNIYNLCHHIDQQLILQGFISKRQFKEKATTNTTAS